MIVMVHLAERCIIDFRDNRYEAYGITLMYYIIIQTSVNCLFQIIGLVSNLALSVEHDPFFKI